MMHMEASQLFTDATFESYNLSSMTTRCTEAKSITFSPQDNSTTCPQVAELTELPAQ